MHTEATHRVQAQYTELPYPPRHPEDERHRFIPLSYAHGLDRISDYCFGGRFSIQQGMRVLSAGGGTGDAVVSLGEQLRDTPSEIVYLDLSATALDIARKRCEIRTIPNVQWRHGSLLDLRQSDVGTFDYIECSGVLHHLEDPQAGLLALKRVLAPGGAMALIVYAKHGRTDFYRTRDALKPMVGGKPRKEKLAIARQFLQENPGSIQREILDEVLDQDSVLYDLLLHEQDDHPFTVPMLHEWLGGAGLRLVDFIDPRYGFSFGYGPRNYLSATEYQQEAASLTPIERQELAERLSGKIYQHSFYAVSTANTITPCGGPDIIPSFSMSITQSLRDGIVDATTKRPDAELLVAPLPNGRDITASGWALAAVCRHMDGHRPLRKIVSLASQDQVPTKMDFWSEIPRVLNILRDAGWVTLRHASVPPFETAENLQRAQLKRQGTPQAEVIVEDAIAETVYSNICKTG